MNQTYLVKDGVAKFRIVLPKAASLAESYAATELTTFIYQMTGATLITTTDESFPVMGEILLGKTNRDGTPCTCALKNDGFRILHKGGRCFILGANDRGTLFGVYALLEEVFGCRWFTYQVSSIPQRASLVFPDLDITQIPPLEYRENGYLDTFYPQWAARNRHNGSNHELGEAQGQSIRYFPYVHTFDGLVPVAEYFDTHPEYFSMIDGKRIRERTQLCLTNPEVLAIAKRRVHQWIAEHPEATIISVSQNDCGNPCACPTCSAVDAEEGTHSGTLLRFVNAIAADIAEEYPHISIDTLAYTYTRSAPKITKPLPNVIIRLCSIECCFSHPLNANCKESKLLDRKDTKTFQEDLQDWGKICRRIYIWDYVVNYAHYLMPFPNFQVLQPNIRYLIANGVTGIYEESCYQSAHTELAELRSYVLAKLLWDPNYAMDAIMMEFLVGYYGMAAAPIKAYIKLLQKKIADDNIHMGIYDPPTTAYLSADVMEKADALFDQAEALADNEEMLERVKTARLSLEYVHVATMPKDSPLLKECVDAFIAKVKAAGIAYVREFIPGNPNALEVSRQTLLNRPW